MHRFNTLLFEDVSVPYVFIQDYLPKLYRESIQLYLTLLAFRHRGRELNLKDAALEAQLGSQSIDMASQQLLTFGLIQRDENAEKAASGSVQLLDIKQQELEALIQTEAQERSLNSSPIEEDDERFWQLMRAIDEQYCQGLANSRIQRLLRHMLVEYHFDEDLCYAFFNEMKERGTLRSMNYMQQVAKDWHQRGLRTLQDFENEQKNLRQIKALGSKVKKALRIHLTAYHETFLKRWLLEYGYDWDVIELALKRSLRLESPSFEYFDAILYSWFVKGLKDKASIIAMEQAKANQKQKKAPKSASGKAQLLGASGVLKGRNRLDLEKKLLQNGDQASPKKQGDGSEKKRGNSPSAGMGEIEQTQERYNLIRRSLGLQALRGEELEQARARGIDGLKAELDQQAKQAEESDIDYPENL